MSLFKKFPRTLITVGQRPIIVTDLFRRIAVGSRFNDVSALLLPYFVFDGETPEIVSNKIYSTPFYHWVIIHTNNIVDPRTEWPLENKYVASSIYEKYDFTVSVALTTPYTVGDYIGAYDDGDFTSAFIVSKVNFGEVLLRSVTGAANIAVSTILKNLTTETGDSLRVSAVTGPEEATHHYVDASTGYIVDNDPANENISPVTNYDYEQTVNDDKRTIRVLDPQYLGQFIRSFEQLVSA